MNIPPILLRVFRRKRLVPYTVDDENIVFAFPSEADLTVRTSGKPAELRAAPGAPRIGRGTVAVLVVCAAALAGVAIMDAANSAATRVDPCKKRDFMAAILLSITATRPRGQGRAD